MKGKFKNFNTNSGFSLVELIVVIAIMVILISLLVPNVLGYIERANNVTDITNAKNMGNYLQLGLALSNDGSLNYTNTPWTSDPANLDRGYIYVDDDELRTSSIVIAEILEENGILKAGATAHPNMRHGVEPTFPKEQTNILCKSSKTWDRYQINFAGKGRALHFSYSASRNGSSHDDVASESFATMIGGSKAGSEITLGDKD